MPDTNIAPVAWDTAQRQQAIESLYIHNFDHIQELIHSDPHVTLEAETQITEGLAKHLPSYDGKLTDAAFRAWATEIITPVIGFHAIRRVSEPFIHAAIWRTLRHSFEPNKFDDYAELVRELTQEVHMWVYLHQADLRKPGTAKITSRVYERAVVMTKAWLKQQQTRRSAVIRRVYDLPSKAQAQRMAAGLDAEAVQVAAEQAEAKEIRSEMQKEALAA